MTDYPEFNPTVKQTLQTEEPEKVPPIPVTVTDPAQVRSLPAKTASFETFTLTAVAKRILGRDPRRKRAVISIAGDEWIVIGATQADASRAGATVSGNVELTSFDEVWATASTDAMATGVIGVVAEIWTD